MFTAHKMLLEKSIGELANMDTKRVISQLRSRGLLTDYDLQVINHLSTASDKNTKIIDELKGRGPTAFDTFFQILSSIDTTCAEKLLPVQYRILWFTSSPRYAAAVTYILEKYFNALMLKTEGQKPRGSYLLRRGRIFKRHIPSKIMNSDTDENCDLVRMAQDAELYLAFPISERGDTPQKALREVFQELGSKVTVAILSGVCEGVRGDSGRPEELGVRGGDVVLATEAISVEGRKRELPLSSALMEAKTYLFELPEKKQDWFEEAKKKLRELEQADIIPVRDHPRFVPHFDTICQDATPTETRLPRALASDPDTFPFYDLCTQHLGVERPWFSCKGVISHTMLNNVDPSQDPDSICALMSTFFAVEACKAIVNKLRQSSQTFNTRAE